MKGPWGAVTEVARHLPQRTGPAVMSLSFR